MSPSDALYSAVCAAPHDDLPRLVYADWLEENGRPHRAEFVRVQCRLADASPADADYVDLLEREAELKAILWRELDADRPALPVGIGWEPEHRGFAERLRFGHHGYSPAVTWAIPQTFSNVPVGGVRFSYANGNQLDFGRNDLGRTLTSLELDQTDSSDSSYTVADIFRDPRMFPNLRRLVSRGGREFSLLGALADTPDRKLTELHLPGLHLSGPERRFPSAGTLRSLSLLIGFGHIEGPLPELHTLTVGRFVASDAAAFAALPKLAGLTATTSHGNWADLLTRRKRPMAELRVVCGTTTKPLVALFRKEWMSELQVFQPAGISESVRAVLQSDRLTGLRQLWLDRVRENTLSARDLLGGVWWPTLTTLDAVPRFPRPDHAERFLRRLVAPNLKHLNLKGVPLGDDGAVALAENPSLGNLTRLNLSACGIGPRGVEALLNSPHLQRLIELNLYANRGGEALTPLADEGVMPNLGLADVAANGVSDDLRAKLEQRAAIRGR